MNIAQSVLAFLNTASVARSIAFGLIASMALTQGLKFLFPLAISDTLHRAITMFMAFFVGFIVCMTSWPKTEDAVIAVSFTTGLVSPIAYKAATAVLYHYLPWIEPYLSARPRTPA